MPQQSPPPPGQTDPAINRELLHHGFQLIGLHAERGVEASNSFISAFIAALRVDVDTPPTVVDPPDLPPGGKCCRR